MQAHANRDISGAIVVNEMSIKRIWAYAEEFVETISAEVHCADEITRTFNALQELLDFENNPRSKIKSIDISGRSRELERSIQITLGRSYSTPSSFSIRGEEMDVSSVQEKIHNTIIGMKAWYSKFATVDLFYVWCFISILAFLIIQIMAPSNPPPTSAKSFREALFILPYVSLWIAGIVGILWAVSSIRSRFFPIVCYALGQGLTRYQFDENIRWVVIVGFVIGLISSATFSLIGT